jgi:hypothetical protein
VVIAKPEPEPTPEERKKSLNQSIEGIKGIMSSSTGDPSNAEHQKEMKIWKELLDMMQTEKENLEKSSDNTDKKTSKTADPNKK